ncbi:MAG: DEAD/DEAH box helicase [Acidimicrobiaceae bacterium]|nr:DEAD/DEAH box helicase [Acidimicrobiaceae bacterium]MYE96168.1 DEAD/DEAH box helicase [Acidimicrobiaceae bacterium]MYI55228.1 DEAD/DEAH box helicase [Acidimicrobiaceae bacterium]
MSSLRDVMLKLSYHKGEDDIAADFYLPCMRRSHRYDRAVGFFSSSVFVLAWPSLREFAASGGRMRLVCSPALSSDDIDALNVGYSPSGAEQFSTDAREELQRLLASPVLQKPTKVLASLVAGGVIDLRIAWIEPQTAGRSRRIFHDKVGIFSDVDEQQVVFKGSMNETWLGLSADGNLESIDVFASWRNEENERRVADEVEYFDNLWHDQQPGVTVTPFPEVVQQELLEIADELHWEDHVDEICQEMETDAGVTADHRLGTRTPRPHQVAALDAWEQRGRRGILEHATGSGKTFTALCAIHESLALGEVPLVLVPSELLLAQWQDELTTTFESQGLQLLVCGGGHRAWEDQRRLSLWTRDDSLAEPRAVLSTIQTASSEEFRRLLRDGSHLFVVADEVHRTGSPTHRQVLHFSSGPRMGLSATPRRAGDPVGTAALMDYFDGIVPPPFTLQDAIAAGSLTPYSYRPHRVSLDADEQDEWDRLTAEIGRHLAIRGEEEPAPIDDAIRRLLIQRARVAKKAAAKSPLAAEVVSRYFEQGQRWLVYCEDREQLRSVRGAIGAMGVREVYEYHSAMEGDPESTLRVFEQSGGVVIAIRCLDEGVDIPATTHALILASSRNPREFIQRRGRVLRTAPGKSIAHIHDAIVLPSGLGQDVPVGSMVKGELARAIEFGQHAVNPDGVVELKTIAVDYGLDWKALVEEGFEIDEDE